MRRESVKTAAGLLLAVPLLMVGALGQPTRAQDAPHRFLYNTNPSDPLFACGAQTRGQLACQAGSRCKCIHEPFGNAMLGLDPGYRWDCSPKHGTCLSDVPAETTGSYGRAGPSWEDRPIIVAPRLRAE